jgi:hypothetical protein
LCGLIGAVSVLRLNFNLHTDHDGISNLQISTTQLYGGIAGGVRVRIITFCYYSSATEQQQGHLNKDFALAHLHIEDAYVRRSPQLSDNSPSRFAALAHRQCRRRLLDCSDHDIPCKLHTWFPLIVIWWK